jgi:excisionase family DNA binding protein
MLVAKKREPIVLTVAEVAQILRIGRISAYQAVERGDVPSIRIGRRILIPRAAFESWLTSKPVTKPAA